MPIHWAPVAPRERKVESDDEYVEIEFYFWTETGGKSESESERESGRAIMRLKRILESGIESKIKESESKRG